MTPKQLLSAIDRQAAELLAESTQHGGGRSERRYLWVMAADGWVRLRDLPLEDDSAAGRKRRQRLIAKLEAAGLVQLAGGERATEIRLTADGKHFVESHK